MGLIPPQTAAKFSKSSVRCHLHLCQVACEFVRLFFFEEKMAVKLYRRVAGDEVIDRAADVVGPEFAAVGDN